MRIQKINNNYSINNNAKSFKGYVNGKYYDQIYMDILAEEFKGEYIKNKNIK